MRGGVGGGGGWGCEGSLSGLQEVQGGSLENLVLFTLKPRSPLQVFKLINYTKP